MSTTTEAVEKKTLDEVYEERNMYFLLALVLADRCGASVGMRERDSKWNVFTIEFPGMSEWAIHMREDEVPSVMYALPDSPPYQPREDERHLKLMTMRNYVSFAMRRQFRRKDPVERKKTCDTCGSIGACLCDGDVY